MTKTKMTIEEKKAKKAAYDKARRAKMKAEKAKAQMIKAAKVNTKKYVRKVNELNKEKYNIDWKDAVQITKDNRRNYWGKPGFIKIEDTKGQIVHVGYTKDMGKIFSNYYNCAKYNQCYDFNLQSGEHKLFFVER